MSDVVIQVENLGEMYRIGRAQRRHDTLRDMIVDAAGRLFHPKPAGANPNSDDRIWALKGVSFEVKRGER